MRLPGEPDELEEREYDERVRQDRADRVEEKGTIIEIKVGHMPPGTAERQERFYRRLLGLPRRNT